MQCSNPMIRCEWRDKWETAADGHRYRKPMIFGSKQLENFDFAGGYTQFTNFQIIECGQCMACRLKKSGDWANRGYLESTMYDQNYFVTLTYDNELDGKGKKFKDEYIPDEITTSTGITYTELEEGQWKGCLKPDDLTKFKHDLRQEMERKGLQASGIREISCGEYGSTGRRPHFHLILFNCKLPADSFYSPIVDWEKNIKWKNHIIEKAWGYKGYCEICEASWNTIAYTARYITKKQNGKESEDYYAMQGEIPEIFRSSRGKEFGGIGKPYYDKHKDEIYKNDNVLIVKNDGSFYTTPPKYFDRLFEKENPERMKQIKEKRAKAMLDANRIKDKTTSLTRYEQLQLEARTLEQKEKALIRPLDM